MTGWLPAPVEELFGTEATADESYDVLTVDVPPAAWISALETARDELGCTYFDWLSAVDEPATGFRVSAHVVALAPVRRLLVRTTVPHDAPVLPSAVDVYAGAAWHERETHEMFGVDFEGHPGLNPLLLPDGFEGHPLRKDFVLAARVAKAWPGAKEPGESEHGGPKRRQMLPPGVPDPNEWGPLKGQLPPAPARPARGAGRAAGERPVRRARTAGEGSASQAAAGSASAGSPTAGSATAGSADTGSTSAGAASSAGTAPETRPTARRARTAGEGSATQRTDSTSAAAPTPGPTPDTEAAPTPPSRPRSADAPWHHARPTFDEAKPGAEAGAGAEAGVEPEPEADRAPKQQEPERSPEPKAPEPKTPEPKTPEPSEPSESSETPAASPPTIDENNTPGGPQ